MWILGVMIIVSVQLMVWGIIYTSMVIDGDGGKIFRYWGERIRRAANKLDGWLGNLMGLDYRLEYARLIPEEDGAGYLEVSDDITITRYPVVHSRRC